MTSSSTLPATMRAVQSHAFGDIGPSTLQLVTLPLPLVKDGECLVKICASSMNPLDWKLISGNLQKMIKKTHPYIPLIDISGEIVSIPQSSLSSSTLNPSALHVGDKIFCCSDLTKGAFCEYISLPLKKAVKAPNNIPLSVAASVPLVSLTSYQALLIHGKLKSHHTVFIKGGSSGTGMYGIFIAKSLGCRVITTCSERNVEFVKGLGADIVLDYGKINWWEWVEKVKEKKEGKESKENKDNGAVTVPEWWKGIDVFYNCIGGKEDWDNSKRLLNTNGSYVAIVGDNPYITSSMEFFGMIGSVIGRKFSSLFGNKISFQIFFADAENATHLTKVRDMIEAGTIKPYVEKEYQMEEFVDFFLKGKSQRTVGKIIVNIDNKYRGQIGGESKEQKSQ